MLTWKQFKKEVEDRGVKDECFIDWIDITHPLKIDIVIRKKDREVINIDDISKPLSFSVIDVEENNSMYKLDP